MSLGQPCLFVDFQFRFPGKKQQVLIMNPIFWVEGIISMLQGYYNIIIHFVHFRLSRF